jgi:hypothetical protein
MSIKSIFAAAALAALGAACGGGSSGGSATFTGNVRGQPLTPKDAISTNATIQTQSGPANVVAVVITNQTGLCANVTANKEAKNSQYFVVTLGVLDSSFAINAPTATGTFSVYSGVGRPSSANLAIVVASTTDATCKDDTVHSATGITGSVVLSAINGKNYTGTFDLNVSATDANGQPTGTADHVTGSFSSVDCPGLSALVAQTRNTTCI